MRKLILSSVVLMGIALGVAGCGSGGNGGVDGGGLTIAKFGVYPGVPFTCGGTFVENSVVNKVRIRYPNTNGEIVINGNPLSPFSRIYGVPVVFSNLEKVTVRLTGYRVSYRVVGGVGFVPGDKFESSSGLLQSSNSNVNSGEGGIQSGQNGEVATSLRDCLPVFGQAELAAIGQNLGSYATQEFQILANVIAEGVTSAGDNVESNPLDYLVTFRP